MLLWNTEQQVEVLVTSTAGFCRGDMEDGHGDEMDMEDGGRFDIVLQKDSGRWMGGEGSRIQSQCVVGRKMCGIIVSAVWV